MGDFNILLEKLNSTENKKEINIENLEYENLVFKLSMNKNSYDRINKGDILIFNHKTNQYRKFKFIEKNNDMIKFICDNIYLIILPITS